MFTEEVKIKTTKGNLMIREVEPDQTVPIDGGEKTITNWEYCGLGELVELVFDDKSRIRCTPSQKFLVNTESGQIWAEAGELKKKALPTVDGSIRTVINLKEADIDDVYEIIVEGGCFPMANGVIAGSTEKE